MFPHKSWNITHKARRNRKMEMKFETRVPSINLIFTAWKVSRYVVFSSPYFPVSGLNSVNLHIQCKYRKIRTRKIPYLDTFHAVLVTILHLSVRQICDTRITTFHLFFNWFFDRSRKMVSWNVYQKMLSPRKVQCQKNENKNGGMMGWQKFPIILLA